MVVAEEWIEKLHLKPHPEGGFYTETYRSAERIAHKALPARFGSDHSFSTAIYFLLRSQDISHFHRIKSDELWFYHAGSPIRIFILSDKGLETIDLGFDLHNGEVLQATISAGVWFGAKVMVPNSYGLVSCTVSPGFEFEDFELAKKEELIRTFPSHIAIINELSLS